jgi:hypothetical protein
LTAVSFSYCVTNPSQTTPFRYSAKVIFNESHWMNANAAIIYISYLMSMFRGKTVGLIWDKHTSHYCDEVKEFIDRCNADPATTTRIVLELVDEGLTPIVQVPDVAVNKVFKAAVKRHYHVYRSELTVKVGQKISVSRETVVNFVLQAINDINEQNEDNPFIMNAFKRCGLNPWSMSKSLEAFDEHLNNLEANEIMQAMLSNQKAETLGD